MPEIAADAIDRLITVEMRTQGVPRGVVPALYAGVRAAVGAPLVLAAARLLRRVVAPGDRVVIATGAGHPLLLPRGETDGPLGAAALARALDLGLGAVPVFACSAGYEPPIVAAAEAAEVSVLRREQAMARRHAGWVETLLPGADEEAWAERLLAEAAPSAVIAIELKGPGADGAMRYMTGRPVTGEAGLGPLFAAASARGIATLGIGDGGNEIGFGAYGDLVARAHPHGRAMACATPTDALVVAATSNWGAYGVAAALALLLGSDEVLHDEAIEARMLEAAVAAGAGDGIASRQARTVDGQPAAVHVALITMLRAIVRSALRSAEFTLEPQQGGGPPSSPSPTSSTI